MGGGGGEGGQGSEYWGPKGGGKLFAGRKLIGAPPPRPQLVPNNYISDVEN